ncbi:unnamed protein product [Acanthosepion pharaonis]|uniref:Reverse transcriptase domain-containing protein n=1 Tax=Acanthosepion pharaonis TaxID=158019 RepID=A0A812AKY3_ACAPH|nr:unnamed protein product [Sepia pharaonis]
MGRWASGARNYRILRRQLREAIRTDSNARWSRVAEEAERASACGDTRKLYQLLKQAGRGAIGHGDTLLVGDGSILTEVAEKVNRWHKHFDVLLNHQPPAVQLDLQPADGTYNCSVDPPTIQEILSVLRQLRNNKAPGEDGIPAEVYKALPDIFAPWLHRVFNVVWTTETVPDDWGHAVLLPFFKKGDRKVCSNYRGISLLDVAAKTFAVLLLKRFQTVRDARTHPTQCGFRPGKGCVDQIFNLRRTLEQRWAYQQPTVLCFIDFAAAFDSVDRDALWKLMLADGIPVKLLHLIQGYYRATHGHGHGWVYGEESSLRRQVRVPQECALSPTLFNFCHRLHPQHCPPRLPRCVGRVEM